MTARHPATPTLADWLADPRVPLRIVEDLVDPAAFEATAILEQLEPQGAPPVLFPRVRSLDGSEGEFQLLFNAYGALPSVAAALGASAASWPALLKDYVKRVRDLREPTRAAAAAVHENVIAGSEVDLRILPWTKHVAGEGGEYFTPIAVARDPSGSRRYNLSWNRAMYLDPRRIGVHISPRDLWSFHRSAEGAGKALPVALVLGHHPAFNLGAAALASSSLDEYHVAGALLGEGVRIAPSRSYGEELMIPADAEVVIEGRLLPGVRTAEGPFGEYLRYLGPQKISHVVEVDAITWRNGAVILEIFTCHLDHLNAHVSIEASFLEKAQAAVPQVSGVSWFRGGGPTTLVIAMRKTAEGQPMRAAMAALSASNLVKQVIVVDDDIDIENSHQVLWAVSTRLRAESGLVPLRNLPGIPLDPSGAGPFDPTSGFVMDATWPVGRPYPPTGKVADSVLERFPLSRYRIKDPRC